MRIGVRPGQWGWSFPDLGASWEGAEEAGFEILSCFDHVSAAPKGLAAWNAPSLLAAMAARTTRIALAVDVLNVSSPSVPAGRPPRRRPRSLGGAPGGGTRRRLYHLSRSPAPASLTFPIS